MAPLANLIDEYKKRLSAGFQDTLSGVSKWYNPSGNVLTQATNLAGKSIANWAFPEQGKAIKQLSTPQGQTQFQQEPANDLRTNVRQYIGNRYIAPIAQVPYNLGQTFGTNKAPLERVLGGVGVIGGTVAMVPDPIGDVGMPVYDYLKGVSAAQKRGEGIFQSYKTGIKSLTGQEMTGLGTALPGASGGAESALNLAELPLMIFAAGKFTKTKEVDNLVKRAAPEIENTVKVIKQFDTLTANEQMIVFRQVEELAKRFIPKVVGSEEMKRVAKTDGKKWLDTLGTFLQDRLMLAQNPEMNVGFNTKAIKRFDPQTTKEAEINKAPIGSTSEYNVGRMRGFPETVIGNKNVPQEVKQAVASAPSSYYTILKNKDVVNKVSQAIKSDELGALNFARNGKDTDANATAVLLIKKYLDEGKYDQATQLINDVSPRFTAQGQQVQILSLFDRLTPTGAVKYAQKIAEKAGIKITSQQVESIAQKAEALKGAVEGDRLQKTAELVQEIKNIVPPSLGQKVSTIQTMAQLLNPTTAIRNVVGNTIFSGLENVSDVVGTGVDIATSLVTGKRSKTLPSITAQLKGAGSGLKQGVSDALKGIDTSRGVGTQFDLPSTMTFQKGLLNKLEKVMNIELRAPDRAAYEAAFQGSLDNQMRATGVAKATEDMLVIAHADALYRTFQDNSFLARLFSGGKKLLNANQDFGVGDLILKYPKTPANILSRGLDYSPVGFVKGIYQAVRPLLLGEAFNQKAFTEALSRGMVGSGLIAAGIILAKSGIVSGRPEKDKDIAGVQKATGGGPFKINVSALKRFFLSGFQPQKDQQNDLLLSYDWAQPTSIPVTMGVNYSLGGKSQDAITSFLESVDASAEALTQQPLFKGVTNLATDISQRGVSTAIANSVLGAPASFVPTVSSKVAQTLDPMARETYDPNVTKQAVNQVVNKTPILRTNLPEKVDVFGKPVQYGSDNIILRVLQNFISPAIITKVSSDPGADEVLRIFDTTGETSQAPQVAARSVKINGDTIKLTPQQISQYQTYMGTRASETLNKLVADPRYQKLDDQTKAKLISSYLADINAAAKIELFGNKPESMSANVKAVISGKNPIKFTVTNKSGKIRVTRLKKVRVKKIKMPKLKKVKIKKLKTVKLKKIKV